MEGRTHGSRDTTRKLANELDFRLKNLQADNLSLSQSLSLPDGKASSLTARRSGEVKDRVRAALATIETELAENHGNYPHNKGRISFAEIARRAKIHPTTFYTENQKDVFNWVKQWRLANKSSISDDVPIERLSLAKRVAAWGKLYAGLQQSHRDTELDLQQARAELVDLQQELNRANLEKEQLLHLLDISSANKIHPILSARTRKP